MAKVLTQEEREKIKGQIVDLVRQSERESPCPHIRQESVGSSQILVVNPAHCATS